MWILAGGALAAAAGQSGAVQARTRGRIWLLAHAKKRLLYVVRNGQVIRTYHPVAHGADGVAAFRIRGSSVTPSGTYRLSWRNANSDFHLFFGLNYPSPGQAVEGFRRGVIDFREAKAIIAAHEHGRCPPQDTALGGDIGLHGVGWRNPEVNYMADWTAGCLAVTNRDIDEIARLTGGVGTVIRIVGKDKI